MLRSLMGKAYNLAKRWKLQQRIKRKSKIKNKLKIKNTITKMNFLISSSVDWTCPKNQRDWRNVKRSFSNSNAKSKKHFKKRKNWTLKNSGTISKGVPYESSKYQKDTKRKGWSRSIQNKKVENFAKLIADTKPQTQGAQRTPTWVNTKVTTHRHIIFKLQKTKDSEKILKDSQAACETWTQLFLEITAAAQESKRNSNFHWSGLNLTLFLFSHPVMSNSLVTPWTAACQALPVLHHLPKFAQVYVHWVGGAIKPSHLLTPSSPSNILNLL